MCQQAPIDAALTLGWTLKKGIVHWWLSAVTFQVGVPKFPDSCLRIRFPQLLRQRVHLTGRFLHLPLFRILAILSFGLRHHMPRLIALKYAGMKIPKTTSPSPPARIQPFAAKKLKLRFGDRHFAFLLGRQKPVDFGFGHFFHALEKLRLSDLCRPI